MKKFLKKGIVRTKALKEFDLALSQFQNSNSTTSNLNQIPSTAAIDQCEKDSAEGSSTITHCILINSSNNIDLNSTDCNTTHISTIEENPDNFCGSITNEPENSYLIQNADCDPNSGKCTDNEPLELCTVSSKEFLDWPLDFSRRENNDSGISMTEEDLLNMNF